MLVGFVVGLPANFVLARLQESPGYRQLTLMGLKQTIAYAFGVAPLALAYASCIALVFSYKPANNFLKWLAPQGRMALTNYLMQTLIGIFTFSQMGFDFQTLGPTGWTIFAFGIFILQVILSNIWLRYFRFGPMEWIWRQLTYGKRLPLKKDTGKSKTN
jgi:uncharacterized protein